MVSGKLRYLLALVILLTSISSARSEEAAPAAPQKWLQLRLGTIGSASADMLKSAFQEIKEKKLDGLVIALDTPGGSLDATRTMVQDIMSAPVPTLVWVGPSGAHAGSAGSFITLAAHVASMAPGTNIGAAHPIELTGRNIDNNSDLKTKIENDTVAFIESIADARGRNRSMAASFVTNSLSITAEEALSNKVIDTISPDVKTLLQGIEGREIKLGDKNVILHTANAEILNFEKSFRHELLEILSNPNLFYLLFIVGLLGLAFEFTHPGVIAPGVIGALCLILALIASSTLPVNFGAMLLITASVIFMVAEIFIPSFGALGIGGLIGFVTGSVLLIDDKNQPGMGISYWVIVPATLLLVAFTAFISWLILKNLRSKAQTGIETFIGRQVEAAEYFIDGHGRVRIEGEYWNGIEINHQPVKPGDTLIIAAIDGLTLHLALQPQTKE